LSGKTGLPGTAADGLTWTVRVRYGALVGEPQPAR
jgi:hypothetical protein